LLGRGWIRFDMRDPTKLVARKPGASLAHSVDVPAPASASDTGENTTTPSQTAGANVTGGEG
jgi:cell division protein FtsQ